ncbi:hypothetical protein AB0N62_44740 [Streptomyces sp. NPDC093982]|uniref:hypothetical protein n=1 Tax=Streptomyces sp. NPDC093982 TaxID=3155077 RepID=UPI003432EF24
MSSIRITGGIMNQKDPQLPPLRPPYPSYPPRKRSCGIVSLGCGLTALIILIVLISLVARGGSDNESDSIRSATIQISQSSSSDTDIPASQRLAEEFKDYVAKHGSETEKTAVNHVTKIQGANSKNDVLDTADVYTDYEGGFMGGNAGNGKLIASTFADWQASRGKDSKNGLVTIYDKDGEILSNGKY